MILNILVVLGAFVAMEFMAWFTHKYVMHGFLWIWHKSHHSERKGWFELNDLFGLIFAAIAILFIQIGFKEWNYFFWAGSGITLYGLAYFIFHDVIVHRRVKINFAAKSKYLQGIIRAHKIHHKSTGKEGAKSFGFLFTLKKYREIR